MSHFRTHFFLVSAIIKSVCNVQKTKTKTKSEPLVSKRFDNLALRALGITVPGK